VPPPFSDGADRSLPSAPKGIISSANSAAPLEPTIHCKLAVGLQRLGQPGGVCATLETLNSDVFFADKADAEKRLRDLKRG
jgi:hypothetical protein